jgi:hypothetical protein
VFSAAQDDRLIARVDGGWMMDTMDTLCAGFYLVRSNSPPLTSLYAQDRSNNGIEVLVVKEYHGPREVFLEGFLKGSNAAVSCCLKVNEQAIKRAFTR